MIHDSQTNSSTGFYFKLTTELRSVREEFSPTEQTLDRAICQSPLISNDTSNSHGSCDSATFRLASEAKETRIMQLSIKQGHGDTRACLSELSFGGICTLESRSKTGVKRYLTQSRPRNEETRELCKTCATHVKQVVATDEF